MANLFASASSIPPSSAYSRPSQKLDLPEPFGPYRNVYFLSKLKDSFVANPLNGPIFSSAIRSNFSEVPEWWLETSGNSEESLAWYFWISLFSFEALLLLPLAVVSGANVSKWVTSRLSSLWSISQSFEGSRLSTHLKNSCLTTEVIISDLVTYHFR